MSQQHDKEKFEIRLCCNTYSEIGEWEDLDYIPDDEKQRIVIQAYQHVLSREFPEYEIVVYSYPRQHGDDWDGMGEVDMWYPESGKCLMDVWEEIGRIVKEEKK